MTRQREVRPGQVRVRSGQVLQITVRSDQVTVRSGQVGSGQVRQQIRYAALIIWEWHIVRCNAPHNWRHHASTGLISRFNQNLRDKRTFGDH